MGFTEEDVLGKKRERIGLYNPTAAQLREACDRVKKERVLEVIEIAHKACRDMGIENPKVLWLV